MFDEHDDDALLDGEEESEEEGADPDDFDAPLTDDEKEPDDML